MSDQVLLAAGADGTPVWTTINVGATLREQAMNGIQYCQPIETYAWSGLNFLLLALGAAVLIGAATLAYSVYKDYNKNIKKK